MQSKVHPTYKTKYRVANWSAYNRALVRRGDVTVWLAPEAIAAWTCPSRIRCQAATGSWTRSRQWETHRTLLNSARAIVCRAAKVNGVWPFNDAWLRTAL